MAGLSDKSKSAAFLREGAVRTFVVTVVAAILLAGCATAPSGPTVKTDEFSKDITIVSVPKGENPFAGIFRLWRLRSWVNKDTGVARHQLYVDLHYNFSWKFFQSASDESATPLNVVSIDKEVIDCHSFCDYSETVGIELSDATLRSHLDSGYRIKLGAKSGDSVILEVTPEMLAQQFAEVDKYAKPQVSTAPATSRKN